MKCPVEVDGSVLALLAVGVRDQDVVSWLTARGVSLDEYPAGYSVYLRPGQTLSLRAVEERQQCQSGNLVPVHQEVQSVYALYRQGLVSQPRIDGLETHTSLSGLDPDCVRLDRQLERPG